MRQCVAGGPLPTAPRPCRSVSQEYHCPLAQAGRQCIAGDARPTAPREGGSERREYHSPMPSGNAAVRSTISTAHSPQAAWQCVTLPTAPCPQQQCSRAHTVQCGAEHQAVRHHTEGTGGAARHAGCSGQMRPCVTARRRRQGSVGQVRECTGLAMPQHTYTQRAHNTHSPARLPVPVGRHPGLCLLVTAPSAHHTTPHHTTPHHTAPHHTLSTPQLYPWAGCRVRSPRRQGPGTALRQCTNSVGCEHAPVPSTIPRDPAAPSTGRLGPGNGQRPLARTADLASPSSAPSTPAHTQGPLQSPGMRPPSAPASAPPSPPPCAPVPPPSQPHVHPRSCRRCGRRRGGPPGEGLRRHRRSQVCTRETGTEGARGGGRPQRGERLQWFGVGAMGWRG